MTTTMMTTKIKMPTMFLIGLTLEHMPASLLTFARLLRVSCLVHSRFRKSFVRRLNAVLVNAEIPLSGKSVRKP